VGGVTTLRLGVENLCASKDRMDDDTYHLTSIDERVILTLIVRDGMINATRLCAAFNKTYSNFRGTRPYENEMEKLSGVYRVEDIEIRRRGGRKSGTWVSPALLPTLCDYLSNDPEWRKDVQYALSLAACQSGHLRAENERRYNELRDSQERVAELEKQIQDSKYDTEIEVTHATFDIECENEKIMKENEQLKRKCAEAQKKYDEEIGYKRHWNKYISEYKTVYEYARDMYRVDMTEATFKKVDKIVAKKQKERYADAAIRHNLYTQLEKYSLLVSSVRPLNPEMLRPPEPRQPPHFKKCTPRTIHTYHKRDWDLIDGLLEMYENEPAYM
jgi:hypothetical protein